MAELYEKQKDGSLKPIEYPVQLVNNVAIYDWLRNKGLSLEEIKFLIQNGPIS